MGRNKKEIDINNLKELKIQGYSNKKIAKLFNVSEETIRKKVRNNNLKKQNKVRPENKGLSKHPMYSIWRAMNERCNNPTSVNYKYYGACGVRVCKEWNINNPRGLINFIQDMYKSYKKGFVLDKDTKCKTTEAKFYSKETCCWVSPAENSRHTKRNRLTIKEVKEIKRRLKLGHKSSIISKDYNTSASNIRSIKNGKSWKEV